MNATIRHTVAEQENQERIAECGNCGEVVNRLDLREAPDCSALCPVCFVLLRRLRVGRLWTIADRTGAD